MKLFWSLFTTRPHLRHYARVDQSGICRALKHCAERPAGSDWVEVTEQRLAWLDQPLPASARISRQPTRAQTRPLLTA